MIDLMLVDDHPLLREGLRTILATEKDLCLVAEAANGHSALAQLEQLDPRPGVILLDVRMPDEDGFVVLRRIRERYPDIAVVMLTMHGGEAYLREALAAGASGYLLKDQASELIPHAVRTVAAGGTVLPPDLLTGLLAQPSAQPERPPAADCPLSEREIAIVRLIAQGFSNRAIADELHLAEATIKKYVQSLTGKLGAGDRGHAAILAMRLGIIE